MGRGVAQFVKPLLQTPEIHCSKTVIGNFINYQLYKKLYHKDENEGKEVGKELNFKTRTVRTLKLGGTYLLTCSSAPDHISFTAG